MHLQDKMNLKLGMAVVLLLITTSSFGQVNLFDDVFNKTLTKQFNVTPIVTNIQDTTLLNSQDYESNMESAYDKMGNGEFAKAIKLFKTARQLYQKNLEEYTERERNKYRNPYPDFYLGGCFTAAGNLDSAIYYFNQALKEMPYFIDAYINLGNACLEFDQIDKAIGYYEKGLTLNSKLDVLHHNIGYCYYLKSDFTKANKALMKNTEINPEYIQSFLLLGNIAEKKKDYKTAIKIYTSAINANPNSIEAYQARGSFYLRYNKIENARTDYNQILTFDSEEPNARLILAIINLYEAKYKDGVLSLAKLLQGNEKFIANLSRKDLEYEDSEIPLLLNELSEEKYSEKEIALFGLLIADISFTKNTTKSITECQIYLIDYPNSEMANRVLLYAQNNANTNRVDEILLNKLCENYDIPGIKYLKAKRLYEQGKYNECVFILEKLIVAYPQFALAHYYKGLSMSYLDKQMEAIRSFEKTIENAPDYTNAYNEIGNVYENMNMNAIAIQYYKKALNISDLFGWPYNNIGLCFGKLDNPDSALFYYNKAIEINSNNGAPLVNRGRIYQRKGMISQALADFDKAISINSKHLYAYKNRGDLYFYDNQLDKALADYSQCIALQNDNPNYHKDRGNVFMYKKQYDAAIYDFRHAISLDNQYSYAYGRIGDAFRYSNRYDSAYKYYEKAIASDSTNEDAEFGLAFTYMTTEQYDAAIVHFKNAISLDAQFSSAYGNIGWTYYLIGEFDLCIENSQMAVKLDDDAFYAMFNMALATLCKGEFESAKSLYVDYMKLAKSKSKSTSGALADLKDLIAKGQWVKESNQIIKEVF